MIIQFDTTLATDGEIRAVAELFWKREERARKLAGSVPHGDEFDLEEEAAGYGKRALELEAILEARAKERLAVLKRTAAGRPGVVKIGDMVRPCFDGKEGARGFEPQIGAPSVVKTVFGSGVLVESCPGWCCHSWIRCNGSAS